MKIGTINGSWLEQFTKSRAMPTTFEIIFVCATLNNEGNKNAPPAVLVSQHCPPAKKVGFVEGDSQKTSSYQGKKKPFAEYLQQILERVGRVPVTSYFHGLSCFNKCTP